jgi:hypothetical protein
MSEITATEKNSVTVPEEPVEPFGISGWMVFPMLITLGSVAFNVWDLLTVIYDFWNAAFQNVTETGVGVMLAGVAIGVWVYASILMFRHSRKYPKVFIILCLVTLAFFIALSILMLAAGEYDRTIPESTGRALLACIIWIPYMLLSKRVRNTFVK